MRISQVILAAAVCGYYTSGVGRAITSDGCTDITCKSPGKLATRLDFEPVVDPDPVVTDPEPVEDPAPASEAGSVTDPGSTSSDGANGESTVSDNHIGDNGEGAGSDAGDSVASAASQRSVSTLDDVIPQDATRADPVDITTKGYAVAPNTEDDPPASNVFDITKSGVNHNKVLDTLEVDADENAVGVMFANNAVDESADRLPLRKIAMYLWQQKSGKSVGDLKSINYQSVLNTEMVATYPKAYSAMGKSFSEDLPLTLAPGDAGFPIIMNTAFGGGASKMLAETKGLEGRSVNKVTLFTGGTDVEFYF